jgi:hypothetical protein
MSGALSALGVSALVGADILEEVFLKPHRAIGTIIPECAIEERHSDRLQIAHHPVEFGAEISDHCFMLPFEVSLRYGWSNAIIGGQIQNLGSRLSNIQSLGSLLKSGTPGEIYTELQALQASRKTFDIVTGKREYKDMLITEMEVTTDVRTENALMVEIHCQQVIIVSTSAATISPPSAQTMPGQTADAINTGQQQLVPVPSGVPTGVA